MGGRQTWTDCDEAGDYVVPNVLSPRDLVSRPDKMDETVLHTHEPRHEKPCLLHMRKHRRISAARLPSSLSAHLFALHRLYNSVHSKSIISGLWAPFVVVQPGMCRT